MSPESIVSENQTSLNQAYLEIPSAWYEMDLPNRILLATNFVTAGSIAGLLYEKVVLSSDISAFQLAGGMIAFLATIADRYSITNAFEAIDYAKKHNIPVEEKGTNTFVCNLVVSPKARRVLADIWSIITLAEAPIIVSSAIYPPVSIPVALILGHAALQNQRIVKRYRRAVEIAEEEDLRSIG